MRGAEVLRRGGAAGEGLEGAQAAQDDLALACRREAGVDGWLYFAAELARAEAVQVGAERGDLLDIARREVGCGAWRAGLEGIHRDRAGIVTQERLRHAGETMRVERVER